jgi:hypothetical protein
VLDDGKNNGDNSHEGRYSDRDREATFIDFPNGLPALQLLKNLKDLLHASE